MTHPRRLLGAVLVVLAAPAAAVAGTLPGAPPAGAQGCGPAPSGRTAVMVVVDTGTRIVTRCAVVDEGATGGDALVAALGRDQVRTGDGIGGKGPGFVCGLLDTPRSGCVSGGDQPSWHYWHADPGGSWRFAQSGFLAYRVSGSCAVDGWTWGVATVAPRTPPPASCDAPAPPTTAPRPPAAPPAPAGGSAGSAATGAAGGNATRARPAAAPAPGGAAVAGATTLAPGAAPAAGSPAETGTGAPAPGPTDPAAVPSTGAPAATATSSPRDDDATQRELAATSATDRGGAGGPGTGLLVAVTLLVALAAVAIVRHRLSRPSDPADT